jgi:hypothetical protein
MRTETALELIDGLTYKPGWKLIASDHSDRFEGAIKLHVEYLAANSNRELADAGYPEQIVARAEFPIMVGDCDEACTLYRRIIDALMEIELHEAREFLRVRSTGWAPFHPHRLDGMRRWDPTNVRPDFTFGIA